MKGEHSAALDERNWSSIANFILTGQRQDPPVEVLSKRRSWLAVTEGWLGPIWLLCVAAALLTVGFGIFVSTEESNLAMVYLALYLWFLWKIATWL